MRSSMLAPAASEQGPAGGGAPGGGGSRLAQLQGVWLKDPSASDMASYGRALQLMQVGGIQRTTAMQVGNGPPRLAGGRLVSEIDCI